MSAHEPRQTTAATTKQQREDEIPMTVIEHHDGNERRGDEVATTVVVPACGTKSTAAAREAYLRGDVEASIAEHKKKAGALEQHPLGASEYIKALVFGGLDGLGTTFAVVTAAAGAGETWQVVLVIGIASGIADAFSMGFGEFVGGVAERDHAISERAREEWEVQHNIQGEIDEMVEIYEQKGFPKEDAERLVRVISKDPKLFVDIMMVEELGILFDPSDKWEPLRQGLVMFLAFIFFGSFPLLAYTGGHGQGVDYVFGISCGLTGFGLLLLGAAKGYLTEQSIPSTAVAMLANGTFSGGFSFAIGILITYIVTGKVEVG